MKWTYFFPWRSRFGASAAFSWPFGSMADGATLTTSQTAE